MCRPKEVLVRVSFRARALGAAPYTESVVRPRDAALWRFVMEESLFEQLGGYPAVDAAVDVFYRRVLLDHRVSHFFDDTDMDAQREKQKAFLTMVFGGPHEYKGKDLRKAHAHLVERGLDHSHFDAVAEHLRAVLQWLEVPASLVDRVMVLAGGTRGDVLNR